MKSVHNQLPVGERRLTQSVIKDEVLAKCPFCKDKVEQSWNYGTLLAMCIQLSALDQPGQPEECHMQLRHSSSSLTADTRYVSLADTRRRTSFQTIPQWISASFFALSTRGSWVTTDHRLWQNSQRIIQQALVHPCIHGQLCISQAGPTQWRKAKIECALSFLPLTNLHSTPHGSLGTETYIRRTTTL